MSQQLAQAERDAEHFESRLRCSTNRDEALGAAIKAAEASMAALKLSKDSTQKSKHSANVRRLLEQAEKIKLDDSWSPENRPAARSGSMTSSPSAVGRQAPESTRTLPKSEQILLLKSGYLNGFKFPFWTEEPASDMFKPKDGEPLFVDTSDLPLSEFQEEVFDDWKRPADALPPPTWYPGDRSSLEPVMRVDRKIDLVQDAATDCSVVASLCAAVARAEAGHLRLLPRIIYPNSGDSPAISPSGKYVVKLNFNGCFRKVIIDDRLPVSHTGRIIHVVDRQNPNLLWPPLIEKAYLKVRGGYDFPGSNSGTDLWILTGWIPEQVFLQSDELDPQELWDEIYTAFHQGRLLVTMGTGKMSAQAEKELGLAGEHDYAVLDLRVVDGQRLILVKNPWCEGTSWKGRFNAGQRTGSDASVAQGKIAGSVMDFQDENQPLTSSRDLLNADDQLSPGTFWIDLDNVIQLFESLYLNWNSSVFSHRQDIHFTWDLSDTPEKCRGRYASLTSNPQFSVKADRGGRIWVLLWRHFRNVISEAATDEEIESGTYRIDLNGHMTLSAFAATGNRVLLPEKHLEKGWFVDSPQTLLRLENCVPGEEYTIVPLEQDLDAAVHTFTMSAFSDSALILKEASHRFPYSHTLHASWDRQSAGGNAHSPRYCSNPQFAIIVPRKTALRLLLETKDEELNVHVKLVHGQGDRVHSITNKDIVFDSKDYRHGCCVAEHQELSAGKYTIVCSTFEPDQLADFNLRVESMVPTQTTLLPRDGAGRVTIELNDVDYTRGQVTAAAPIRFDRLVNMYIISRNLDHSSPGNASKRSLIRISIEGGSRSQPHTLAVSNGGEYSDALSGIRTAATDFGPNDMKRYGQLWLILDRVYGSSEGHEESFSIELFVDQLDSVTVGAWQDWSP